MIERPSLTQKEFKLFKEYIYEHIGISLGEQKIYLVQARLAKRLKTLQLESFSDYYALLVDDKSGQELEFLASLISTNVTSFFREAKQWDFWKANMNSLVDPVKKRLRIWSAACSTGEEPYSIMMFLDEHLPERASYDIKLLATDVSPKVLQASIKGIYAPKAIAGLSNYHQKHYFDRVSASEELQIKPSLKRDITFRAFNLVTGDYSLFKHKTFNIIFCRNVMIYFDKATQETLIQHFHDLLAPKGYLFIGSSEALTDAKKGFISKGASIYQKV